MHRAAVLCLMVMIVAPIASGRIITISPDGAGEFPDIQSAIADADSADVIELLDGTFTGEGNRNIDFMGKAVTVRSQRGDPETCIINCTYSGRAFIFDSGEESTSILEGLTITGGYLILDGYGGAIYCNGTSPRFSNCKFSDNVAGEEGGAVYIENSLSEFENCTFSNNTSLGTRGGGVTSKSSHPYFSNCVFSDQSVDCAGGAISINEMSATFELCEFNSNHSSSGGAVYSSFADSLTFNHCSFNGNSASGPGGAIEMSHSGVVRVNGCNFSNNSNESNDGGALRCIGNYPSAIHVTDCSFTANTSQDKGGAIHFSVMATSTIDIHDCVFSSNTSSGHGGALYSRSTSNMSVSNTLFAHNYSSEDGGGIFVDEPPSIDIEYCVFWNNTAEHEGGALHSETCSPNIRNCTLVGNTAPYGGGIRNRDNSDLQLFNTIIAFSNQGSSIMASDDVSLVCCDLYGNDGGNWIGDFGGQLGLGGNISENPFFCDPDNGDFSLGSDSPCAPFSEPNELCDQIGALPVGCGEMMAVPEESEISDESLIKSCFPNPSTGLTVLTYAIPGNKKINTVIEIYDVAGRLTRTLENGKQSPGIHAVSWDSKDDMGNQVSGGLYYYHVSAGDRLETGKMLIVR